VNLKSSISVWFRKKIHKKKLKSPKDMLKWSNFSISLGGQPREGVVHGPNPCTPSSKPPHLPPSPFLPPSSLLSPLALGGEAKGEGREEGGKKGGGRGRGVSGGKGGLGFHPAPPFPRPTMPYLWIGPPNFGASVVFTARPAQRSEKTIGAT
jgi:hypothetical protein